jgi:hypothetical protein
MNSLRPFIFATAFLLVSTTILTARPVNCLSYQELFAKSDLVVIAKPLSTHDLTEQTVLPDIGPDVHVVGLSTKFAVRLVIKGDKSVKRIVLHHYRLENPKELMMNGPLLVSFDPAEMKSFLLFLKKEADGRFEPINGQTDPGVCGIPADIIDLIVIAKPVSAKKQVDETTWPGQSPPVHLVGYQTEFTVQEVLKGDNTAKKFVLHHYERTGQDGWNSNRPDPFRIDFKPEVDRWYLLILKQEAEGRFAPIPRGGGEMLPDGFPVIRLGIAPL